MDLFALNYVYPLYAHKLSVTADTVCFCASGCVRLNDLGTVKLLNPTGTCSI